MSFSRFVFVHSMWYPYHPCSLLVSLRRGEEFGRGFSTKKAHDGQVEKGIDITEALNL